MAPPSPAGGQRQGGNPGQRSAVRDVVLMRGDAIPLKRTAVAQRLSVKRKVTGRQHIAAVNGIDRIQCAVARLISSPVLLSVPAVVTSSEPVARELPRLVQSWERILTSCPWSCPAVVSVVPERSSSPPSACGSLSVNSVFRRSVIMRYRPVTDRHFPGSAFSVRVLPTMLPALDTDCARAVCPLSQQHPSALFFSVS